MLKFEDVQPLLSVALSGRSHALTRELQRREIRFRAMRSIVAGIVGFIAGLAVMSLVTEDTVLGVQNRRKPIIDDPRHEPPPVSSFPHQAGQSDEGIGSLAPAPAAVLPPASALVQTAPAQLPQPESHTPKLRLRLLVLCGGNEHHDGGPRIFCTNYFSALKHHGHDVKFATVSKRPALQAFNVVVIHGGDIKEKHNLITELRSESKQIVICVMKVNGVDVETLNKADLMVPGSWFHGLAVTRELEENYRKVLTLKHIELEYDGSVPDLNGPKQLHRVFNADFNRNRRAVVCYHGNDEHLNEGEGIFDSVLERINERIPLRFVAINRGKWTRGRPTSVTVKEQLWKSMKNTFEVLSQCDIGLSPQLVGRPTDTVCDKDEHHKVGVLSLSWKNSANAGRAFVFAQLGVPFITGPDFETIEMLAFAGLPTESFVAIVKTEWEAHITKLLSNAAVRQDVSERLLSYAKDNLDILKESRRLEAALIDKVAKRR